MIADVHCLDCEQAKTAWNHHGYRDGCRGCVVRSVATTPMAHREHYVEHNVAAEEREAFARDVDAEINRVAELRMREPA